MLIQPFQTTGATRIFVRMGEQEESDTLLSRAESQRSFNKTASDLSSPGHKTRDFFEEVYDLLRSAFCKLVDVDMLLCILLLLFEIWIMALIVSRSRADCHVEERTVSPRPRAVAVVAASHAIETWPFWMLSACHLNTLTIQVAPASCQDEGFEILLLRRGSDSSDGSYVQLPIENQVLRRCFVRAKNRTRYETEMKKHRIGFLHVRNRKAVVFSNPVLSSVAEVEVEIEYVGRDELRAPRKNKAKANIPERTLPEPLRLVFYPVGKAPCAPPRKKKAKPSSFTLPESCILFPSLEVEDHVQSMNKRKVRMNV